MPIPVGYANEGIDLPHHHAQIFEIYLIARGTSTAVVNQQPIKLQAGDMLVVEPGESHTFTQSSEDYFHFVIQTPFIPGDKVND
ncbi:cupin domain-containing protein [Candidatus Leptofilum sp.]|uniref:cupin domain-containing protein n=1 Tax=Candidatus Leptofilum sp. TaxID=3241576 RepID=UPI003B59F468